MKFIREPLKIVFCCVGFAIFSLNALPVRLSQKCLASLHNSNFQRFLRKIIISIVFVFALFISPLARAESFTVSGILKMTDPANNPYSANYLVETPSGGKFYFKLSKDFYGDWVEKDVYFHVNGDYYKFAARSSGKGVRDNTYKIPATGSNIAIVFLASAILAGYILIQKSKCKMQNEK